jgi:receptor protein-tyrosine kinase
MFANLDSKRQSILVTSSVPNEGKTFSATNLAISMAKSGRSVLLLDADMRNPSVANLLGLENSVGLITVLLGRTSIDEAIQEHASGVSFLGTGPLPPNPAEVLDTSAMRNLVRQLSETYDVVIIDAPPLLPVADSTILLTEVDGAILLVRHGETHREHLRQAVNRIEAVNGRMVGTILNCAPQTAAYGYYGYGYGYGTYGQDQAPSGRRVSSDKGRRARR